MLEPSYTFNFEALHSREVHALSGFETMQARDFPFRGRQRPSNRVPPSFHKT